jgi:hypothetical protein
VDRGGDIRIDQAESVVPAHRLGLTGETEAVKRTVEPVARAVSSKDAPGSVPAVGCRRQSHNKQVSVQGPQTRYWSSPVFLIPKAADFFTCHFFAICGQPRAKTAILDFVLRAAAISRQGLAES